MEWYLKVIKDNYANLNGRARRKEYWMFVLINTLISAGFQVLGFIADFFAVFSLIYSLAVLVPAIAVSVRRMHDIGKSGLWVLIVLIPVIGWIWTLVLHATDGEPGTNQYGPNPKDESFEEQLIA